MSLVDRLSRYAPGLPALVRYRREDLPHDFAAGLAVAAVAIPSGLANAQLAGFTPVGGLYASILPLVVYALFATSRTLVVGPGAAVAAIIASAIAPLAGGDEGRYLVMATWLTFFTGVLCIGASFLRLGALADFLSKPILIGFLNGVAISVVLSQVGVLFGISLNANTIVGRTWEFVTRLPQTHWPTLAIGVLTILVLGVAPRVVRYLPGTVAAMIVAGTVVQLLDLAAAGVLTVGPVPAGFPRLSVPPMPWTELPLLVAEAAGISLVMFSTSMVAARAFAERNGYEIDADREIAAFGAANLAAALSQGFVVQGTNSQTAVGEAAGARTQMTGIISAVIVAVVVAMFTWPLQFIPRVSLAAVLMVATAGLFSWANIATIRRISVREFWIAMAATVGVVAVGVMNAILIAVMLAIVSYLQLAARPKVATLGTMPGQPGIHPINERTHASAPPGLVLFRFDGPIIFFSAAYFKQEVNKAVAAAGPELKWFVVDLLPVNMIDATGVYTILEVFEGLRSRGIVTGVAARDAAWVSRMVERGFADRQLPYRIFVTLRQAIRAYRREVLRAAPPAADAD